MTTITLEEYLQKYYGLKGPLYRKKPYYTNKSMPHWWTKEGEKAYERFVRSIYDLTDMAKSQGLSKCEPINYREVYNLLCITDGYEYEDPANG